MELIGEMVKLIDWSSMEKSTTKGETGAVISSIAQIGTCRVRILEFSPGYCADDWCDKGHVFYVIEGVLLIDFRDETSQSFPTGMSGYIPDAVTSHLARTEAGAKVFLVD